MRPQTNRETATLAGGCFWCLEAVFSRMKGVGSALSGYMGGTAQQPTYREVCSGRTGHAEVVQLAFEPAVASFRQILEVFFAIHDPTTLNRQGQDVGTQYRSAIFFHSAAQKVAAQSVIAELTAQKLWDDPIVTAVEPASQFWVAEDYHQDYFTNHPDQPYCGLVVAPKVARFRKKFAALLRS